VSENPISTSSPDSRAGAMVARIRGWPGLLQPRGSLWRNPAFLRIWLANTIDDFGTRITALAIPLTAAITLRAGPVEMGLLAAMHWLPYFALGLFAGVLVDRRPRQQLMILVNVLRAALLGLIPLAAVVGLLRIELLYLVAMLAGACGVVFDVAYVSWLPSLVARKELHDANGKMEATYASAQAAGPGIAGVLVGLVSAPFAIAVDAVSFAVSAALIRSIRPPRPDTTERGASASEADGDIGRVRAVFHDILGRTACGVAGSLHPGDDQLLGIGQPLWLRLPGGLHLVHD
jgi:MFS family permease